MRQFHKGAQIEVQEKKEVGLPYIRGKNPNQISDLFQSTRADDFVVFELTANGKTP